jgi:hypothetical protein
VRRWSIALARGTLRKQDLQHDGRVGRARKHRDKRAFGCRSVAIVAVDKLVAQNRSRVLGVKSAKN